MNPERESLARTLARLRHDLQGAQPPAELTPLARRALTVAAAAAADEAARPDAAAPAPARSEAQRPLGVSRRGPPVRLHRGWALGGVAFATAALLAIGLAPWRPGGVAGPDERAAPDVAASAFVPLVTAERWQALVGRPQAMAWLVTAELPSERLAVLGLPFDPARAGETEQAELLLHASGELLAVRVRPAVPARGPAP